MAKLLNVIQGTQAWAEARAGRPTASQFDRIITPGGAASKSASTYCNQLLAEVMLGRPLIGAMTNWMERGKNLEEEAIKFYEFTNGVETVPVGLFLTDDERIGASPDRLVGDNGLVEVKAPSDEVASKYLAAHIDALLGISDGMAGSAYAAYKCQVQGQLFVSERQWCDVIAFYPGLPSGITRVTRDEKFIAEMKKLLYEFLAVFDERLAKLKALGYLDEATERKAKALKDGEVDFLGLTEQDVEDYLTRQAEKAPATVVDLAPPMHILLTHEGKQYKVVRADFERFAPEAQDYTEALKIAEYLSVHRLLEPAAVEEK